MEHNINYICIPFSGSPRQILNTEGEQSGEQSILLKNEGRLLQIFSRGRYRRHPQQWVSGAHQSVGGLFRFQLTRWQWNSIVAKRRMKDRGDIVLNLSFFQSSVSAFLPAHVNLNSRCRWFASCVPGCLRNQQGQNAADTSHPIGSRA